MRADSAASFRTSPLPYSLSSTWQNTPCRNKSRPIPIFRQRAGRVMVRFRQGGDAFHKGSVVENFSVVSLCEGKELHHRLEAIYQNDPPAWAAFRAIPRFSCATHGSVCELCAQCETRFHRPETKMHARGKIEQWEETLQL